MKLLKFGFLIIIFLYIYWVLYLYFNQDKLIFQNSYAKPIIPKYAKVITYKTSDGVLLEGGYLQNSQNAPLVLYFGGNATNVLEFLDDLAREFKGYNFIGFNYPGYGNSEGKPSQKKILKYALEIAKKYKPQIVIGRSLGTAVASYVAYKIEVKKVILITPFDSIEHIAKIKYPFFPISLLLKHKFKELEYLKKCKSNNIYAIFVKNDEVIPKESIEALKNSINFKKIITIDATHNYIYDINDTKKAIKEMLDN